MSGATRDHQLGATVRDGLMRAWKERPNLTRSEFLAEQRTLMDRICAACPDYCGNAVYIHYDGEYVKGYYHDGPLIAEHGPYSGRPETIKCPANDLWNLTLVCCGHPARDEYIAAFGPFFR